MIKAKKFTIRLLSFYQQFLSPLKKRSCRFYPSCSEYAKLAIKRYGFLKGCFLSLKRILKCNPFSKGKIDYP